MLICNLCAKMKVVVGVCFVALSLLPITYALLCYECSGSETSDCAKGVKGAGAVVKCETPNYDPPRPLVDPIPRSDGDSTTESDASSTTASALDSNYQRLKKLGCYDPIPLYPACVVYSMKPYNGLEGQKLVYRSCMLSPQDFCHSHTQFNKDNMCKSCNNTDFCM